MNPGTRSLNTCLPRVACSFSVACPSWARLNHVACPSWARLNLGQDAQATDAQAAEYPTLFDSAQPIDKRYGAFLPHWTQDGATYFATFRLADSLPRTVVRAWKEEQAALIGASRDARRSLTPADQLRLQQFFSEKVERYLNAGHGDCWMKRDDLAHLVADSLGYFDGQRYFLWAWCVMPNHVHVVVQPLAEYALPNLVHSWKSYTAKEINRRLDRTGAVWQQEYYDHLIRNEGEFKYYVEYTVQNPKAAGLQNWRWVGARGAAVSAE